MFSVQANLACRKRPACAFAFERLPRPVVALRIALGPHADDAMILILVQAERKLFQPRFSFAVSVTTVDVSCAGVLLLWGICIWCSSTSVGIRKPTVDQVRLCDATCWSLLLCSSGFLTYVARELSVAQTFVYACATTTG